MKMIWVIGTIAAIGLAAVTVYLIVLNWNQQLGATLLSVALGGTVTLFIAVFSQLKESAISSQFALELPFDTSKGLPVSGLESVPKSGTALRRSMWLTSIYKIAVQSHMEPPHKGGSQVSLDISSIAKPITDDQMFTLAGQLIQYKLLEDLRDHGVSSRAPIVVDGGEVPSFFTPESAGPVADYPRDMLRELLTPNQFSSGWGWVGWEHRTLRVPPDARVSLRHVPNSETTGVTKDLIIIERPTYFRTVITIEPVGAGRNGNSPIQTVRVVVSMKATFFKMAAGSTYSAGAKSWCDWLFRLLEELNA